MRISEDKKVATIEVSRVLRAEDLEKLIEELSALRAQMLPAVPTTPSANLDPRASRAGGDPCVQVAVMRDGLTRFWVRHAGLGWFGFNLPVDRARTLAQYILGLAAPRESGEFFGRKRRESDSSH